MSRAPGCEVAILAGGQGTRLRSRAGDLPKPMVPVAGRPLLEHQIELCRRHGFKDILLLLHYRHEVVQKHFGDGADFAVRLSYAVEQTPRGTAGALRDALPQLAERFLLLYGDTYVDVDLRRFWRAHVERRAHASLLLHPNDHPHDSDLVVIDRAGSVRSVLAYPHAEGTRARNLVNAALYVLERGGLADFAAPAEGRADVAKDMFPAMLAAGRKLFGYVTPEYIKDAGTPERLDKVESDIESGVVERLSTRGLRQAVFLDRDGTVNREVEHLREPAQLQLLDGAAQAIRRLNRSGRLAVVVTNQPVVARGDVSDDGLEAIHAQLDTLLGQSGAYLDALYFCPHHPDAGFAGEVAALKLRCDCRKPRPGLLDRACTDLRIDRRGSWMVGDSTADIEAGRRAGVRTILVRTGHAGRDDKRALRPDYIAADLASAVDWALEGHARLCRAMLPVALACDGDPRLVLIGGQARAGKSSAAQVLKELLETTGRQAHVISLDAWLRPAAQRSEGAGVLQRFDMAAAYGTLAGALTSKQRVQLRLPVYDRRARAMHAHQLEISIGTHDMLIVEGVPALLDPGLRALPHKSVYMQAAETERQARLRADHAWRGTDPDTLQAVLASRDTDETPAVAASRVHAEFVIDSGAPP